MSTLKEKILRHIAHFGPITIAQYMEMALYDPEYGYYMKGNPIGGRGDFVTAPEISQMFGELIGLWFVHVWEERGKPERFSLVELGPGHGTLMADMLRAARLRSDFLQSADVILLETSASLRAVQRRKLKNMNVRWCNKLGEVDSGQPLFLVANEFLDALPIRQAIKIDAGWHERLIGEDMGNLIFRAGTENLGERVPDRLRAAPVGSIFEFSPAIEHVISQVSAEIVKRGGVGLFIDYGHDHSAVGDTFQAVKSHAYADLLAEPGDADLTAHVDFEALATFAHAQGAKVFGPEPQGAFLEALGIHARADKLRRAQPSLSQEIDNAVHRLIFPSQMGALFKVLAIADREVTELAGLSCSS